MFNFSFIEVSGNSKTGPIPVTRTDSRSCPDSCVLKGNGCYASLSYAGIHWKKLDNAGITLAQLCTKIKKLNNNELWRHNEAGDLPGQNDSIDVDQLNQIVKANRGKRGFTYSHYPISNPHNLGAITDANNNGFTINVSVNSVNELMAIEDINLPKAVIVDDTAPNKFKVGKTTVMICPAQIKDSITCKKCGLCQVKDRKFAIGFRAHGTQKNKIIAMM